MKKLEKQFIIWTISFMLNLYYVIHETGFWKFIGIPITTLCLILMIHCMIMSYKDEK